MGIRQWLVTTICFPPTSPGCEQSGTDDHATNRALNVLLSGYEQAESEKRLYKTSTIAGATLLVVGSATGAAALLEANRLDLALLLPFTQTALLGLTGGLHIWSLNLTAQALRLELRINNLVKQDLLVLRYPSFDRSFAGR